MDQQNWGAPQPPQNQGFNPNTPYPQQPFSSTGVNVPGSVPPPPKKKNPLPLIIGIAAGIIVILTVVIVVLLMRGSGQNDSGNGYVVTSDSSYDTGDGVDYGDDSGDFDAIDTSEFYQGYTFYFGSYPQTMVRDTTTIAYLDDQAVDMDNMIVETADDRGYTGTYTVSYGDFDYNGERYRKAMVILDDEHISETNGYYYFDGEHKFEVNHIYYFRWEPVEWTVRGIRDDEYVLVSQYILDFVPKDWAESDWDSSSLHDFVIGEMQGNIFYNTDSSVLSPFEDGNSLSLFSVEEITDGHLGFTGEFYDMVQDYYYEEDPERSCEKTDYADFLSDGCYNYYALRSYDEGEIVLTNATHGHIMKDDSTTMKYGIRPIIKLPVNQ